MAKRTLYEGLNEGDYIDGDFHDNICAIDGSMRILNETFPNPKNPKRLGFVRNVWNIDGLTLLYCLDKWSHEKGSLEKGLVKVTLFGEENKFNGVEEKINYALRNNIRDEYYPTKKEEGKLVINIQPRLQ